MKMWGAAALVAAPVMAADVKPIPWTDNIKLKGDVRVREEYINQGDDSTGKNGFSRNRMRLRGRLEADAKINSEVKAVLGLTTDENSDPVSGNQTLGAEFNKKSIYLDLAYVDWKPSLISETGVGDVNLLGGKMKNPFLTVSELIWDSDVTPEGLAMNYVTPKDDNLEALANGGALWYMERKTDAETMIYAGQVGLKIKNPEGFYALVGGSMYYFSEVEGYNAFDYAATDAKNGSFYGNSKKNKGTKESVNYVYANNYHEVEGLAAVGMPCPITKLPWKLYGDYVQNTSADDNKSGFQAGLQLSELKNKGDIMVGYAYRKLEADATLGALTDSDWWGGGTDGKGHQVKAGYQMLKNWSLNGTYFFKNEMKISSSSPIDYDRVQIDVVAKF